MGQTPLLHGLSKQEAVNASASAKGNIENPSAV